MKNVEVLEFTIYRMKTFVRRAYRENGFEDNDYFVLQKLIDETYDRYSAEGFLPESVYRIQELALKKYFTVFTRECGKPDSVFLKLPIEWQWNMTVNLSDAEIMEVIE